MNDLKERVIDDILRKEGGHVNDASDAGGETNFGITERVARKYGYDGPMIELPIKTAREIYAAKYYDKVRADDVAAVCPKLAAEIVDTGVNMGTGTAAKMLQRALRVIGDVPIMIDGDIGNRTIEALHEFASKRQVSVLTRAVDALQAVRYIELVEGRQQNKKFIYGWLKNRTGAQE